MTKKAKIIKQIKIERPERAKLRAEESLMKEFDKRKEKFICSYSPEQELKIVCQNLVSVTCLFKF